MQLEPACNKEASGINMQLGAQLLIKGSSPVTIICQANRQDSLVWVSGNQTRVTKLVKIKNYYKSENLSNLF